MFSPNLRMAIAQARMADDHRAAAARNVARSGAHPVPVRVAERNVTLRFALPADEEALARLAALDCSGPLAHPILLAEVDGQIRAALALSDGTVVANPFQRTADLVDLLRARADQLDAKAEAKRSDRLRSWSRLRLPVWRQA